MIETSTSEGGKYYQRILLSKSVIHENALGSFTCRKPGTWDILFYFPSEGRHTDDFPDARKNPTASAGFESTNSGSSGQYANH